MSYHETSPTKSNQEASSTMSNKETFATNTPKYIVDPYKNKYPVCPIVKYDNLINDGVETEDKDVWVSDCGMRVREVVPCLPEQYASVSDRALYVIGVPFLWTCKEFKIIFHRLGTIESTPCITDMTSKETFRWIVMSSKNEARVAMDTMHHIPFEREKLRICRALKTGFNMSLVWNGWRPEMYGMTVDEVTQLRVQHGSISPQSNMVATPNKVRTIAPIDASSNGSEAKKVISSSNSIEKLDVKDEPRVEDEASTEAAAAPLKTGSWANIAGIAAGNTKTIDLHPEHRIKASVLHPLARVSNAKESYIEPVVDQMRVVMVLNIPKTITLDDISDAVREGAVVSIRFGVNNDDRSRYVGIIFQHATSAEAFFQTINKERVDNKPRRLRFTPHVVRGEPFPMNDTINAMAEPPYATRRLTIVKKGFFFAYGEKQLKNLCEKTVGKENVQLVFLYNGGNATVLFADVESAMKIKKMMDNFKETAGKPKGAPAIFEGIQTTFSKDPCELGEPLKLQSSFPTGESYHWQ